MSCVARPIPLSATGRVVTKHGMVLHTNTVADDPTTTRLRVPGTGGTADL